ncbi:hypothetical protein HGRIS_010518 [Hohenbuehelia grisea]|uniref:NACHT domain-containing protein n=1 Tax=Hohenbuehelia grisea TaxID=104357 RepID=A0ABR3IX79_9AGAR
MDSRRLWIVILGCSTSCLPCTSDLPSTTATPLWRTTTTMSLKRPFPFADGASPRNPRPTPTSSELANDTNAGNNAFLSLEDRSRGTPDQYGYYGDSQGDTRPESFGGYTYTSIYDNTNCTEYGTELSTANGTYQSTALPIATEFQSANVITPLGPEVLNTEAHTSTFPDPLGEPFNQHPPVASSRVFNDVNTDLQQANSRMNVTIGSGATFNQPVLTDVQGNQTIHNNHGPVSYAQADDLEKLRHVPSAGFHAQSEGGCLEGTRVALLNELWKWCCDRDAPRVYWLVGAAGAGKSAIARQIARWLSEQGLLGGSFFCHRPTASRADAKAIVRTLACFLSQQDPTYRNKLARALKDPRLRDIGDWTVDLQIEELLVNLLGMTPSSFLFDHVLVIDALDECTNPSEADSLLNKLLSVSSSLPLKWLITSRPEKHIREKFEYALNDQHTRILRLHDIENNIVEQDINRYLRHHLNIFARKPHAAIPTGWPSEQQIATLAQLAGTLFIYAATSLKYISENPVSRLQNILVCPIVAGKPLTKNLDAMYELILSSSLDPLQRETQEIMLTKRVIAMIIVAREPLPSSTIAELLRASPGDVRRCLDRIHAVVQVPSNENDVVTTFHASFTDFLVTPGRAPANMLLSLPLAHGEIAKDTLEMMSATLRFNIAGCRSSYLPHFDQDMLPIPPALIYSCRHWTYHLSKTSYEVGESLLDRVGSILETKLLYWIEVLGATGHGGSASSILARLGSFNRSMSTTIREVLHEANDFVIAFRAVIEYCVPHIYLSAMSNFDRGSRISSVCGRKITRVPQMRLENLARKQNSILHLHGHSASVNSVAFSPDGTRIVSGSRDNTIRVWNASTGIQTMSPLEGHSNFVTSVAFSPDGTRIVSGSVDNTIRVWNASTGIQTMSPLEGHSRSVTSVAFSPDGTRIVSGSYDNTIRVWNASTGIQTMSPLKGHSWLVTSVAFSPDGTRIVSGSFDNTIRVWNASTGIQTMSPLEGHSDFVTSVAFSPDGTRIVSGSYDNTIRVWNASTGIQTMSPLEGHSRLVTSVAFSPDGTRIVSGSVDNTIRVWNASTGIQTMSPLEGHSDFVTSVAFSPDGTRIVSGSYDNTIRVWNASTGIQTMSPLEGHSWSVTSVAFSPDGTRIVSGSYDNTIRVWNASTGIQTMSPLEGHSRLVTSVAFSPDGTRIVSGSDDNTIRVWNTSTGIQTMSPLEGHSRSVTSVAFSPDGTRIVSGSDDNTIRVWNTSTGIQTMSPLEGHSRLVTSVAFSPDGTRIVSGSYDNTIRVWNASTGIQTMSPLEGHSRSVTSVAFSPDGTRIVSGSYDNTIRVWNASTGIQTMSPLEGHSRLVTSVAFSPDGTRIVSGSVDNTIRVWNASTGIQTMSPLEGHSDFVTSVAFSPDGTRIVSGSFDNTIRVWNASTGIQTMSPLKGHSWSVTSVAFSPDGTRIVSGSDDNTIRVWNTSTGIPTMSPLKGHSEDVNNVPISTHSARTLPGHSHADHQLSGPKVHPQSCRQCCVYDSTFFTCPFNANGLLRAVPEHDGWCRGLNGELLFWLLPEFRKYVLVPPCIAIMPRRSVTIDTSSAAHGINWTDCYMPDG